MKRFAFVMTALLGGCSQHHENGGFSPGDEVFVVATPGTSGALTLENHFPDGQKRHALTIPGGTKLRVILDPTDHPEIEQNLDFIKALVIEGPFDGTVVNVYRKFVR